MEIKKVLVHSCLQREKGFDEDSPLPGNCRCQLFVTVARAQEMVDDGEAQHVAVLQRVIPVEYDCLICGSDPVFMKSCTNCDKTGRVISSAVRVIRGENIVYKSNLKKTPRTATIEKAHIERTFEGHKNEGIRSDVFDELTVEFLNSIGATVLKIPYELTKLEAEKRGRVEVIENEKFKKGKLEPENDPRKHTGRDYDYGRPV